MKKTSLGEFLVLVLLSCNKMKKLILGCVFAFFFVFIICASNKNIKVVLLAGQSNMAGVGNYNALDDSIKYCINAVSHRVFLSVDGDKPQPLSFRYSKYQEDKRGFGNVFGPEILLGLTLAEKYPDYEFLFIKLAQGGTSLYGAWNPEWSADKAKEVERGEMKQNLKLYQKHIDIIEDNLKALTESNRSYEIIGMVWLQGENDAANEVSALSYERNLMKLVEYYRKDLNSPNMPFIIGQINSTYGKFKSGPSVVREAMVNVAAKVDKVGIIHTSTDRKWSDYPKHSDNVHYNTEGQVRFGIAFANELLKLLNY